MALDTTEIDSEIVRVEALIVTVIAQIVTASNTLRTRQRRKAKLENMLGRLNAAKNQTVKFNKLDR